MTTSLIVDDLQANRTVLVSMLRHRGYRLLEAADGSEGLAVVKAERPDLIITDVLMPVMDGFELVRQLRLDPMTSAIPVVFYTAHYGEREAKALALSSGVAAVLAKPAEFAEVMRIVGDAFAGDSDPAMLSDASPLTPEFDREPAADRASADAESDLHVRVQRGRHHPSWCPQRRDRVPAQTIHLRDTRTEDP